MAQLRIYQPPRSESQRKGEEQGGLDTNRASVVAACIASAALIIGACRYVLQGNQEGESIQTSVKTEEKPHSPFLWKTPATLTEEEEMRRQLL